MTIHLPGAFGHVRLQGGGLAERLDDEVGDLGDGQVAAGREVDDLAGDRVEMRFDGGLDALGDVLDEHPVAARVAVAVDGDRLVAERLRRETRDELPGCWYGPYVLNGRTITIGSS